MRMGESCTEHEHSPAVEFDEKRSLNVVLFDVQVNVNMLTPLYAQDQGRNSYRLDKKSSGWICVHGSS